MEQHKETIEITLIEKVGIGSESWDSLKVRVGTGISEVVKRMKFYGMARCEFDWGRDNYLPCTGPLTEGSLNDGETYRVERKYDCWNPISGLCRKFEKSQAQKVKGGERK